MDSFLELLNSHSTSIIFVIMYLEALNLTGIPAFIIFPAIGIFIGSNKLNFLYIFFLALSASLLGSLTYYFIASKFGSKLFDYFYNKFPKLQKTLDKGMMLAEKYGAKFCLIGRLIPSVRTFISLISGVFKIKFRDYLIYSSLGIFIWDFAFIFGGYIFTIKK